MDVITALSVVRDERSSHDMFIGAVEYLSMYRESNFVVHYCGVLCDYVYIALSGLELFYLDFLSAV